VNRVAFPLVAVAAFGLYFVSSFVLEARGGTKYFGADTWFYTELAKGSVIDRIAGDYRVDRIFRFHPTTVVMGAGWMIIVEPLTPWIASHHLLKAMFALVGALGVWAAMSAFATGMPRCYAILFGIIYAVSLGVWYFSSIEESKIVTATLSGLYITTYLHLRNSWTTPRAVLLTTILLLACLNEIVSGFLLIIPVVDALVQRGWDWRHGRWIAWHGLAGPVALAILEGIARGLLGTEKVHPEGATHFSYLLFYLPQNEFTVAATYGFAVKWLFFNIAAPAIPSYGDDFEPILANYLSSPASAGLVIFSVVLIVAMLPRFRADSANNLAGIFWPLLAYALLRAVYFFVLNNRECLLWASGVTLAHLLMIGIPFTASRFPAKGILLAVLAVLIFITNGRFIIGQ
jgi:hypothetical protein